MKFLNVMPTGSIKITDIKEYLEKGATAVGLGHELYYNKTVDEIVESAKRAVAEAKSV